jgi:hypothetical protein
MNKFFAVLFSMVLVAGACAVWDYNSAMQNCVVNHVGDPVGREQCMCDTAKDAGRSCDFLGSDAGDASDAGGDQ